MQRGDHRRDAHSGMPRVSPRSRAEVKDPARSYRDPAGRGHDYRGRAVPDTDPQCQSGLYAVQKRDRLSPHDEALVAVPEDALGLFAPVPVEVLRCVPRRGLAGEGSDGGGWEEVKFSHFF